MRDVSLLTFWLDVNGDHYTFWSFCLQNTNQGQGCVQVSEKAPEGGQWAGARGRQYAVDMNYERALVGVVSD